MTIQFLFQVFPNSGLPIYRQICDQVLRHVASGRLRSGDFLPSVRQTAVELQVNPMTVSKAYSQLERDGVVELVRGQGMRVIEPAGNGSTDQRQTQLLPLVEQLLAEAYQLSLTPRQVQSLVARVIKEREAR